MNTTTNQTAITGERLRQLATNPRLGDLLSMFDPQIVAATETTREQAREAQERMRAALAERDDKLRDLVNDYGRACWNEGCDWMLTGFALGLLIARDPLAALLPDGLA